MKILYGIQGTGHGHISRARELVPELNKHAEIDILISGYNYKLNLHGYNIIKKRGISLEYNKNGCVSLFDTALKIRPVRFIQDIHSVPVASYDLVISDYEPITAWSANSTKIKCVGLSHQAAFLSDRSPRPEKNSLFAEHILKYFAPCTDPIGFHFRQYDTFIEPPVIRKQVRDLNPEHQDSVVVYLPAFDHETLASVFNDIREVEWHIFSPLCTKSYSKGNITVRPISNEDFLRQLESCTGIVTSAGFETSAEAMYLEKKLFIIPIQNQYEQLCNASALKRLGVSIARRWGTTIKSDLIRWIRESRIVKLEKIADTVSITRKLLRVAGQSQFRESSTEQSSQRVKTLI